MLVDVPDEPASYGRAEVLAAGYRMASSNDRKPKFLALGVLVDLEPKRRSVELVADMQESRVLRDAEVLNPVY